MLYSIILACTFDGGIGYNNNIPWNIRNELFLFRQITGNKDQFKQNVIIMGKKTWDSLPRKPLKDRINIIITSDKNFINEDNILSFDNSRLNDLINADNNVSFIPMNMMYIGGKMINVYEQPKRITNILKKLKNDEDFRNQLLGSQVSSNNFLLRP